MTLAISLLCARVSSRVGETENALHCLGLFQRLNEPKQGIAREGALFNEAGIKVVGERAPQEKPRQNMGVY